MTFRRTTLAALAFLLLLPIAGAGPAGAGHGSGFSVSVGFHYPFHYRYAHFRPYVYYPYYYPYALGWAYLPAGEPARRDIGAIRLKVKPKKTEVFLDGEYVGRAGQYDGYPGYLWLPGGNHKLTFYKDGFRTFSREFEVRPGMITDVRIVMETGESRPPEEFFPSEAVETQAGRSVADAPETPRVAPPAAPGTGASRMDLRQEGGRIRVIVEPEDASVYLDGRFLGTGEELSRLRGGLILDVGEHTLEVLHPDFPPDRTSFRVKEGEEIEVRVVLEPASVS
jgi:hypothetical protein